MFCWVFHPVANRDQVSVETHAEYCVTLAFHGWVFDWRKCGIVIFLLVKDVK